MLTYRTLQATELSRIKHIQRQEVIRTGYEVRNNQLIEKKVFWDAGNFETEGHGPNSLNHQIAFCQNHMSQGATTMGAFSQQLLVGIAVLTPNIRPGLSQLAYLYVSHDFRRKGIASKLLKRLLPVAIEKGSTHIYVSATPSQSAVGFYQSQGFQRVDEPDPQLYALEPEDIHMILNVSE